MKTVHDNSGVVNLFRVLPKIIKIDVLDITIQLARLGRMSKECSTCNRADDEKNDIQILAPYQSLHALRTLSRFMTNANLSVHKSGEWITYLYSVVNKMDGNASNPRERVKKVGIEYFPLT